MANTVLEDYFALKSGDVVSECSFCHYETREYDEMENHAFDCSRSGSLNRLRFEDKRGGKE